MSRINYIPVLLGPRLALLLALLGLIVLLPVTLWAGSHVVNVPPPNGVTQPQAFNVIYNFSGGEDGATPFAGVTLDNAGNLYGTTASGGGGNLGTVFKLTHQGAGWISTSLYAFHGADGNQPWSGVVFGPNGTLYGTTFYGGPVDQGTVFNLRPSPRACTAVRCPWIETVLHNFQGAGTYPGYGDLVFDQAGNLYGTTALGGSGYGVVYELTPSGTFSVLYVFHGSDGKNPLGGVIFDSAGNLYGTTELGGSKDYGTVFQLVPANGGWTEKVLYSFQNGSDGSFLLAGLILDPSGNLYGASNTVVP